MNQNSTASATSLLSKFIGSIELKFSRAASLELTRPFYFSGITDRDALICLHHGTYFLGEDTTPLPPGSFCFIPAGTQLNAGTGIMSGKQPQTIETYTDNMLVREFSRVLSAGEHKDEKEFSASYVSFETILYSAVPFFPMLDLPPMVIPPDEEFARLLKEICSEAGQENLGKEVLLKNYLGQLGVHLFRFMESKPALQKLFDKLQYLTDVRLVDIVKYVQQNLEKDLTNAAIAKVAYVSEDYVGQFFKALTGRTLQDYIENQRLDRAMHLLKTNPVSIQEVAAKVGFKDPAYFSRRFRMRFDINANAVRHRKNQLT